MTGASLLIYPERVKELNWFKDQALNQRLPKALQGVNGLTLPDIMADLPLAYAPFLNSIEIEDGDVAIGFRRAIILSFFWSAEGSVVIPELPLAEKIYAVSLHGLGPRAAEDLARIIIRAIQEERLEELGSSPTGLYEDFVAEGKKHFSVAVFRRNTYAERPLTRAQLQTFRLWWNEQLAETRGY